MTVNPADSAYLGDLFGTREMRALFADENRLAAMLAVEAALARVPVVASAVGGIPEVVGSDGEALLCPPGDAEAFAAALAETFADPTATAARVERAFAHAQGLRVGPYLESMDRFLDEALAAAPR